MLQSLYSSQCFWYFPLRPDILCSIYFFSYIHSVHKTVCNYKIVPIKLYDENKMNYCRVAWYRNESCDMWKRMRSYKPGWLNAAYFSCFSVGAYASWRWSRPPMLSCTLFWRPKLCPSLRASQWVRRWAMLIGLVCGDEYSYRTWESDQCEVNCMWPWLHNFQKMKLSLYPVLDFHLILEKNHNFLVCIVAVLSVT